MSNKLPGDGQDVLYVYIGCTGLTSLLRPEDVWDIWPKYVGVVYYKCKNAVQLVGDEICVCGFRCS
jgi:hypothetical protein